MNTKYYTTQAGYRRFIEKMKKVAERYDSIVASNEDAADSGDNSVWHDNFAYEENQRQMHQWSQRFHTMEEIKRNFIVVDIDPNPESVKIGCEVVLYDHSEDKEKIFTIVGYDDGDPERNRISYNSPLAKAILGAGVGDLLKFKIGDMIKELEIFEIRPLKE